MTTQNPTRSGRPPADLALVLGGSRGLGYLVAKTLVERGWRVVIAARDADELDRARAELAGIRSGATVLARTCDVTKADEVDSLIDAVEAEVGPVEAAFHVAGVIQVGPWEATTRDHFATCIDTMLWGPINVALALVPRMTSRGHGRYCVVTSIGGRISPPRLVPYSTAKFGALGLVEGLSAELAGTGVTVTGAVPGLMRTGSHVAATFFGDPGKQYAWFAPAASLPLVSMPAERAAREIVDATLAGKPVVNVGVVAKAAQLVHGVAPSTTVRMMGLVSRLLPKGRQSETVPGREVRADSSSKVVRLLTTLGDAAARRTNQTLGSQDEA